MYPDYEFEIKFWLRLGEPGPNEVHFGDVFYTTDYPRFGLREMAQDLTHHIHISIQDHLNFLDPSSMESVVEKVMASKA